MKIARATIESVSPYSQSRFHNTTKESKELADAYEQRTWREKLHYNGEGYVVIPAMAFKNCISEVAKFLSVQIPGKGKSTYTKHFEAGILVLEDSVLPVKKEDVQPQSLFVPADGVRGSGKRVMKVFPRIEPGWQVVVEFVIYDDIITEDVFLHHLKQAGQLIGIGTFRVRNNGTHGRFKVVKLEWLEGKEAENAIAAA